VQQTWTPWLAKSAFVVRETIKQSRRTDLRDPQPIFPHASDSAVK